MLDDSSRRGYTSKRIREKEHEAGMNRIRPEGETLIELINIIEKVLIF
jgi:hypothetical protein